MIKNVLVINGGGRPHGNTAKLIDSFIKGVTDAGHQAEVVSLVKNEVKPCFGCFSCLNGKGCIQKDSFNSIVPKMKNADLLVLASPLYYFQMNSRMKSFIDRFISIESKYPRDKSNKDENAPTKDIALLMTAEDNSEWNWKNIKLYYQTCFMEWLKFHDKGMILAGGCGIDNSGSIEKTEYLKKAYEFGKKIY